ncbi:MAG: hypothetical protein ACLQUY_00350 [Ktedonobacterales bacterium]
MSSLATVSISECPLHTVMSELAHVSVTQHVLHLEGECLPRSELLAELDRWSSLHSLIRNRICVASRSTPLSDSEFDGAAMALLGSDYVPASCGAAPVAHRLREAVIACSACNQSASCPLGAG